MMKSRYNIMHGANFMRQVHIFILCLTILLFVVGINLSQEVLAESDLNNGSITNNGNVELLNNIVAYSHAENINTGELSIAIDRVSDTKLYLYEKDGAIVLMNEFNRIVANKDAMTQEEIDASIISLNSLVDALILREDKVNLQQAITKLKEVDTTKLSEKKLEKYNTMIETAVTVLNNIDATNEKVVDCTYDVHDLVRNLDSHYVPIWSIIMMIVGFSVLNYITITRVIQKREINYRISLTFSNLVSFLYPFVVTALGRWLNWWLDIIIGMVMISLNIVIIMWLNGAIGHDSYLDNIASYMSDEDFNTICEARGTPTKIEREILALLDNDESREKILTILAENEVKRNSNA